MRSTNIMEDKFD